MKITVQRKFRVNGKEYTSIEQIPPEYRAAVERALGERRSKMYGWIFAALALAAALIYLLLRQAPPLH